MAVASKATNAQSANMPTVVAAYVGDSSRDSLASSVGVVVTAPTVGLQPHQRSTTAVSRVRIMTKWEYLTAPILTHAAKQILDNFGAEGWELVQIAPGMNPENLVGYFKRPLEG